MQLTKEEIFGQQGFADFWLRLDMDLPVFT